MTAPAGELNPRSYPSRSPKGDPTSTKDLMNESATTPRSTDPPSPEVEYDMKRGMLEMNMTKKIEDLLFKLHAFDSRRTHQRQRKNADEKYT